MLATLTLWGWCKHTFQYTFLHGDGYQFWSGVGSGSPLIAGVVIYARRVNCHVKGCPRIQFHPHHPYCRKHHDLSE